MEIQQGPIVPAVPVVAVGRPGVITWFYVYCWILVVMYLLVMLMSLVFFLVDPEELEMPKAQALFTGIIMAVSGAVFFVLGLLPLILRRRPWLWVYDLVVICLGMTSCCFWPVCIPLIIFWIKPGVKEYFAQPK
jgi:hypothetical protein